MWLNLDDAYKMYSLKRIDSGALALNGHPDGQFNAFQHITSELNSAPNMKFDTVSPLWFIGLGYISNLNL